jgi:hypothetical protein
LPFLLGNGENLNSQERWRDWLEGEDRIPKNVEFVVMTFHLGGVGPLEWQTVNYAVHILECGLIICPTT